MAKRRDLPPLSKISESRQKLTGHFAREACLAQTALDADLVAF
jgi:hypothetical protein